MKKLNYKPRYVQFKDLTETVTVDTRKGKDGFYPGDVIKCEGQTRVVLGCDKKTDLLRSIVIKPNGDGFPYIGMLLYVLENVKLAKRHGKNLIKSGKMIQAGE